VAEQPINQPSLPDPDADHASAGERRTRRSPDVVNLAMAVITLTVAAMVLTDWTPPLDPRWLVAGGAVLVGLLLLAASVRPARRDRARQ
jgi:hypothetical protein